MNSSRTARESKDKLPSQSKRNAPKEPVFTAFYPLLRPRKLTVLDSGNPSWDNLLWASASVLILEGAGSQVRILRELALFLRGQGHRWPGWRWPIFLMGAANTVFLLPRLLSSE